MIKLKNRSKLFTVFVISVLLHVVALVIFGSVVLVQLYVKEAETFEAAPIAQSITPPKKEYKVSLEKASKNNASPKLSPILAKSPTNINVPKVKVSTMTPEINNKINTLGSSGLAEGFGSALGGNVDLGNFATIKLFGVESKGQKFFILLDATRNILADEQGGIPGYTYVKDKVREVLNELPDGVLFNVALFDSSNVHVLAPEMLRASTDNKEKFLKWIDPINKTNFTGPMGNNATPNRKIAPLYGSTRYSLQALNEAMRQGCDTLFLLTTGWYDMGTIPNPKAKAKKAANKAANKAKPKTEPEDPAAEPETPLTPEQKLAQRVEAYRKKGLSKSHAHFMVYDAARARKEYQKRKQEFYQDELAKENIIRADKGLPPRVIGLHSAKEKYIYDEKGFESFEEMFGFKDVRLNRGGGGGPGRVKITREMYLQYVANLYRTFYGEDNKKAPPINVVLFQSSGVLPDKARAQAALDKDWFREFSRTSQKGKFDTVRLAQVIERNY